MTDVKDVILIYLDDAPVSFARVESILPDVKKDWFQIKLLMLQIPLQVVTWILKDAYINGDPFQMNGRNMRLETVQCPEISEMPAPPKPGDKTPKPLHNATKDDTEKEDANKEDAKIISFSRLKKD